MKRYEAKRGYCEKVCVRRKIVLIKLYIRDNKEVNWTKRIKSLYFYIPK